MKPNFQKKESKWTRLSSHTRILSLFSNLASTFVLFLSQTWIQIRKIRIRNRDGEFAKMAKLSKKANVDLPIMDLPDRCSSNLLLLSFPPLLLFLLMIITFTCELPCMSPFYFIIYFLYVYLYLFYIYLFYYRYISYSHHFAVGTRVIIITDKDVAQSPAKYKTFNFVFLGGPSNSLFASLSNNVNLPIRLEKDSLLVGDKCTLKDKVCTYFVGL